MGRTRSPARAEAYELYKASEGKAALNEIAGRLGLPEGTIRGWKNKDDWDGKLFGAFRKNTERSKNRKINKKLMQSVEANEELTEKEKLFCFWYIRTNNATAAAGKAGYSNSNLSNAGWRELQKEKVQKEIKRLRAIRNESLFAGAVDVVEKMMQIAFADITAYVEFRGNAVKVFDSNTVDGSLIAEVKETRDGVSIKLADRTKALLWLADYFELNPADKHRREYDDKRLALEEAKLQAGNEEALQKLDSILGGIDDTV